MINNMFNKEWFLENQQGLLILANSWWGKRILCIDGNKSSLSDKKIIAILPNAIFALAGGNKIAFEFRTHDKFSKRIYYTGKPLWQAFHWFDTHLANPFVPTLNLGFDAFGPFYPDSNPETSTVDGYVVRQGVIEVWSTIRGGNGTGAGDTDASFYQVRISCTTTSNSFDQYIVSPFLFDSSSIPDDVTIDAATASIFGLTGGESGVEFSLAITASAPASNTALAAGDYQTRSFTRYNSSDLARASWSTSAYNDFAFNATGITNVSKTGITKICLTTDKDADNSAPTWSSNAKGSVQGYYADQTGTANDPKLAGTYPSTGGGVPFLSY